MWTLALVLGVLAYIWIGVLIGRLSRMVRSSWNLQPARDVYPWGTTHDSFQLIFYPTAHFFRSEQMGKNDQSEFGAVTDATAETVWYIIFHMFFWPLRIACNAFLTAFWPATNWFVGIFSLILFLIVGTAMGIYEGIKHGTNVTPTSPTSLATQKETQDREPKPGFPPVIS